MMNKDNRNDKIRKIVKKGLTFSLCAVLVGGLAAGSFEGVNKLAGWDGAATVEAASNKNETTLTFAKSEKETGSAAGARNRGHQVSSVSAAAGESSRFSGWCFEYYSGGWR